MSIETSAIVALALGVSLIGLIVLIILFVEMNHFNNVTKESLFYVKKWCLIALVLLVNAGGCALVYYTQNLQVILFIIVALKSKDIIMAIMFGFNMIYRAITKKYSQLPSLEVSDEIERVAAFVPVYDESLEQVTKTLDSLLNSKGAHYILPVLISDGKNNYDNLITIETVKNYTYHSWKTYDVDLTVSYGTRNNKHVVSITKQINLGKKDSIILMNDLFNCARSNISRVNTELREQVRQDISTIFGVNEFNYIFSTDSDTIVDEHAVVCLVDTLKTKNATAVAGIVNVNKSSGNFFWNHIQNLQYMYGQYIRRTNEDLLNQVLCLPGCISMIKIDETFKDTLELYSSLPNENNLFETSVQSMGTDRRLTSSIVYTTTRGGAKILQDTRAHAYTEPPQSLMQFFSQRKRWTHNMFFNSILNIIGINVHILSRFFNLIDVLRMCLVYFRLFNTFYFIYLLITAYEPKNILELVPYIILLSFPVVCFLLYSLFNSHLRNQFLSLFVFTFINKVFTMVSTIIIFTLMLFNIGNSDWKISY
jgi:cellulose synthase/poly-beta-1,6-N-acetylglucosamine synthase-like glycosyltransferase